MQRPLNELNETDLCGNEALQAINDSFAKRADRRARSRFQSVHVCMASFADQQLAARNRIPIIAAATPEHDQEEPSVALPSLDDYFPDWKERALAEAMIPLIDSFTARTWLLLLWSCDA